MLETGKNGEFHTFAYPLLSGMEFAILGFAFLINSANRLFIRTRLKFK